MSDEQAPDSDVTVGSDATVDTAAAEATPVDAAAEAKKAAKEAKEAAKEAKKAAKASAVRTGRSLWKYIGQFAVTLVVLAAILGVVEYFVHFPVTLALVVVPVFAAAFAAGSFVRDYRRAPEGGEKRRLIVWSVLISVVVAAVTYVVLWLLNDPPFTLSYSLVTAIIVGIVAGLIALAVLTVLVWIGYNLWPDRAVRYLEAGRGSRWLFWAAALALLTAVAALIGFGAQGVQAYTGLGGGKAASIRDQSVDAAEQAVLNIGNVQVDNLDDWEKRLRSSLTGDALKQALDGGIGDLRKQAKAGRIQNDQISTKIRRSAVTDMDVKNNSATVLVFATSTSTPAKGGQATTVPMNFLIVVVQDGPNRKASKVVPLSGVPYVDDAESEEKSGTSSQSGSGGTSDSQDQTGSQDQSGQGGDTGSADTGDDQDQQQEGGN
ncbi:MAG: ABZJ_00895 family protein [Gordonia sp. (in: high G+C Gram-positive bacteria)]|uniref:ABZJ_00895 family protein n=1 Tax=Gordonia sp. (in: high G+C Gram-positive bacteria) TaxID=84139 RepID=UPI0039E2FA21